MLVGRKIPHDANIATVCGLFVVLAAAAATPAHGQRGIWCTDNSGNNFRCGTRGGGGGGGGSGGNYNQRTHDPAAARRAQAKRLTRAGVAATINNLRSLSAQYRALALFERACRLGYPVACSNVAIAKASITFVRGYQHYQAKRYEQAIPYLRRAAAAAPRSVDRRAYRSWLRSAITKNNQERFAAAQRRREAAARRAEQAKRRRQAALAIKRAAAEKRRREAEAKKRKILADAKRRMEALAAKKKKQKTQALKERNRIIVGKSGTIIGNVQVCERGKCAKLSSGQAIPFKGTIKTGPKASLRIRLAGNENVAIGPDTVVEIDEFFYDPDQSRKKRVIRIALGVFRFVSGKIARKRPSETQIKIPNGEIGIRGTDFVVRVTPSRRTQVIELFEGALALKLKGESGEILLSPGVWTIRWSADPPAPPYQVKRTLGPSAALRRRHGRANKQLPVTIDGQTRVAMAVAGLPSAAQTFARNCSRQLEMNLAKRAARFKVLGNHAWNIILDASRSFCVCLATGVHNARTMSSADKQKVWAVKDFSPKGMPKVSPVSKAGFDEVGKRCSIKYMAVMLDAMKKLGQRTPNEQ